MFGEDFRQPFSEPLDQSTWLPAPKGAHFPLSSRYITEDVPVGCTAAIAFAKLMSVDTPIIHAMTSLANLMLETNYYDTGYGLKDFGLEQMTAADMLGYMRGTN